MDQSEVEKHVRIVGPDFGGEFVVKFGQSEVASFEIQVCDIVVGLEVARIGFQRVGKAVKSLARFIVTQRKAVQYRS